MTASPILPKHPLDHRGVVKIMLGAAASDALRAVGPHHLCIVTEPDATAPAEAQGRMVILCLPLTREQAHDASLVALGHAAARPIKTTKPASI